MSALRSSARTSGRSHAINAQLEVAALDARSDPFDQTVASADPAACGRWIAQEVVVHFGDVCCRSHRRTEIAGSTEESEGELEPLARRREVVGEERRAGGGDGSLRLLERTILLARRLHDLRG